MNFVSLRRHSHRVRLLKSWLIGNMHVYGNNENLFSTGLAARLPRQARRMVTNSFPQNLDRELDTA